MQKEECVRFGNCRDRERNEELIGVLTAISIVSKRLAKRMMALEYSRVETARGGKNYDPRQSRPIGQ